MKQLKMVGLVAMAAMAFAAFLGAGSASANTIWVTQSNGTLVTVTIGTVIKSSIKSGTSAILKDTNNATVDTCTGSEVEGKVESNGNTSAGGKVSKLAFSGCSHTTDVLANGSLEITGPISGTTNGTVSSSGAEVTVQSTIFGASCTAKTGTGTTLGTLTGAGSSTGTATMDINAVISMGLCGDANWTGTYTVTSPTGLVVS